MASELKPGDRVILHLGAEDRHGVVVATGLPDDHLEIELTDSPEAGRKVHVPEHFVLPEDTG